ncbi:DUF3526 domain-containing protein [Hyphococcus sp.]|uniref:DUF3526 domain-containing protein n=1 Tax=Hyphococcus sp. TaxID=2038636 RepID=UPI003CCB87E6
MIGAIVNKELNTFFRSGVFISLSIAVIALLASAAALSAQRIATFERERMAAESTDREVWDNQGERNPHSAAHFSRYAFKPVSALVAFDPGVTDYAGLAVWMEAHSQNPAVFRRAEDLGDAGRIADLSPAWVLQYITPLFLFLILFGAVAGEREQGTLRQMAASGVTARALLFGKLTSAGAAIAAIIIPALLLSLWAAASASDNTALPDTLARMIGLFAAYAVYFVALAGIAIGVSALCREKRAALLALVGLWALSLVLAPRLAAGVATIAYPEANPAQLSRDLSAASNAFYQDDEYREQIEKAILEEYNVDSVEDLPVEYGAYTLQKSEEHAHPLFEAFYAGINDNHRNQEKVLHAFSIFSPVLALENLSAGLSGSDRHHQIAFAKAAEMHRRIIVKQLNDDYMFNAGDAGYGYSAGEALWSDVPDFEFVAPRFASLTTNYLFSVVVLAGYALFGVGFAAAMLRRAQGKVAA